MAKRLLIPGGSGFLGRAVGQWFAARGWSVTVLSRRPDTRPSTFKVLPWDGKTLGPWTAAVDGADAVLNLAGRTVNCRYTAANRREIYASRLDSTRVLGQAIARAARPPAVWLNAASATIYRHAEDRPMDEATGDLGDGFSVDVCRQWEAAFFAAPTPGVRKVAVRSAMVMGPGRDGVFAAFHGIVRKGLGGTLGRGTQYVSWVHVDDFCRAVEFLIDRPDLNGAALDGVVNVSVPDPIPNRQFMRDLRRAAGARIGLPATRWMLEIGAVVLRTETELLLKSRRVVPGRLLAAGFTFDHPDWSAAAADLVARERSAAGVP
jgi:uncharacterized protein (TIGR01777 family)